ncbi:MAG: PAC2 family protein [Dehalococcoidia bacterium]|nr:MAG: PAC2 family protein [Dehalococcoidia bacterium]UCG82751.1 MAG: PAC2 family protein [Dehalococcoidia bacterium]
MTEKQPYKVFGQPEFESSTLVVGWSEDAAKLGSKVTDYLNRELGGQEFAEIEPDDFFPLGGVSVENDIAQFPEGKFYHCPGKDLVLFRSHPPRSDWYRFLNSVLDVAEYYCHVKEIYTVGGMVYLGTHTFPRELMALSNSPEMTAVLSQYDLAREIDYESPPGQRPTLNSFLLWAAQRRQLAAASLWVPIPFYLVGAEDPQAWGKVLEFLDERLDLGIDLDAIDEEAARQDKRITILRYNSPEIDSYINKLESGQGLTQDESESLVKAVEEFLRRQY